MILRTRRLAVLAAGACASALVAGSASAQTPPTTPNQPTASPVGATPAVPSGESVPAAAATPAQATSTGAYTPITAGASVVDTLKASGQFTTFLKAADATALTSVLARPGLTVFVPTDAAFSSVQGLDDMMKPGPGAAQLQKVVAYHIVATPMTAAQVKGKIQNVDTASPGTKIYIDGFSDPMKVNDANVLQADVAVGGSHIYVIDKVVMAGFTPPPPPPEAAAADTKTTSTTSTTSKSSTTTKKKK